MSSYGQFCPVAKTSELLCEKWVPLIVMQLMHGSRRFNDINRGVPLISPALLTKRLRQLTAAGVIAHDESGDYTLTDAGWELYPIIEAMGVWGQRWARSRYTEDDLDPSLLMWDMRRMLQPSDLASKRTVIEFRFTGAPPGKSTYWLVVDDGIDLCLVDQGYPIDLHVRAKLRELTRVWMGDCNWDAALASGDVQLEGPRALVRAVPKWLGQHPILGKVQTARPA